MRAIEQAGLMVTLKLREFVMRCVGKLTEWKLEAVAVFFWVWFGEVGLATTKPRN